MRQEGKGGSEDQNGNMIHDGDNPAGSSYHVN